MDWSDLPHSNSLINDAKSKLTNQCFGNPGKPGDIRAHIWQIQGLYFVPTVQAVKAALSIAGHSCP